MKELKDDIVSVFLDYVIEKGKTVIKGWETDIYILTKGNNEKFSKDILIYQTSDEERNLIFKHFAKICLEIKFNQEILLEDIFIELDDKDENGFYFYMIHHPLLYEDWAFITVSTEKRYNNDCIDFDSSGINSSFLYFKYLM